MAAKKGSCVITYLLVVLLAFTGIVTYSPEEWAAAAAAKYVVVIDPGHIWIDGGGHDSGAVAPDGSTDESKLNPVLANKIAQQLLKKGYAVYTTLDIGLDIPVLMKDQVPYISHTGRAEASNKAKADLFISVHHNGNVSGRFDDGKGTEVLYCAEQWAPGMAAKSRELAQYVYDSVKTLGFTQGNRNSPVKPAGAYVLLKNNAPAITLEAGFLTNRTDLANVKDAGKQDQMAAKVATGVAAYFAANGKKKNNDTTPPTAERINTSKTPSMKPKFSVAAYGVSDKSGIQGVEFEVYRKGKKHKGVHTVKAADKGVGKWLAAVNVVKLFGDTGGIYNVDAYATDNAGNRAKVGTVRVEYRQDTSPPTLEEIRTSGTPSAKPRFTVAAYGVKDGSGVKSVTYKVYPTRKKARVKDVKAKNKGGGKYVAVLNVKRLFGGAEGVYIVDVYAADKKGNEGRIGRIKVEYRADIEVPIVEVPSV